MKFGILQCIFIAIIGLLVAIALNGCVQEPEVNVPRERKPDATVVVDDDAGIQFQADAGGGTACASPLDVVFKSRTCGELRLSKFSGCRTISAPSGCITTAEYECENPCHSSVWMEWNGEHGQVIEASACANQETSVCVYLK